MRDIAPVPGRRRSRAFYLTFALIGMVIVSACAGTLVQAPVERAAAIRSDLDESRPAKLALEADGRAASIDLLAPLVDTESMAGDGVLAGNEPSDRVDGALIVRTANLELEVADVAAILSFARGEISDLGGYVAGSDEDDQGDRRWASVTYRVPVDRFSDAIETLRGLSDRVVRESTGSQEVTATVVDLDARIANLRASEAALVEIMDRSGRIEDVLAVQLRLEDVRGQVERLDAQRKNLADQAALSTLTVSWFTPVTAVTAAQQGWNVSAEVDAALAQTVEALQGLASFGIWLGVVALPLMGIPLLLVVVLYLVLRRRGRRGGPDDSQVATPTPAQ